MTLKVFFWTELELCWKGLIGSKKTANQVSFSLCLFLPFFSLYTSSLVLPSCYCGGYYNSSCLGILILLILKDLPWLIKGFSSMKVSAITFLLMQDFSPFLLHYEKVYVNRVANFSCLQAEATAEPCPAKNESSQALSRCLGSYYKKDWLEMKELEAKQLKILLRNTVSNLTSFVSLLLLQG